MIKKTRLGLAPGSRSGCLNRNLHTNQKGEFVILHAARKARGRERAPRPREEIHGTGDEEDEAWACARVQIRLPKSKPAHQAEGRVHHSAAAQERVRTCQEERGPKTTAKKQQEKHGLHGLEHGLDIG